MGLSSNSSSTVVKPLLLDNYFPFDPYMLPRTKHWVEPHYRPHEVCPYEFHFRRLYIKKLRSIKIIIYRNIISKLPSF
jgi:hypothetical protein